MNFEAYLQQKKILPKGIARHQREIAKYELWLHNRHDHTPENAQKRHLIEYLKHIRENRQVSNDTQGNILRLLKNYYAYLAQEHQISNIANLIKIRGTNRQHLRPLFTPEELDLLCDAYYYHTQEYQPSQRELHFYPNHKKLLQGRYIALTLTACQALQAQEIEKLTQADFDLHKATVNVSQSLAGAARKLPLQAAQIGAIIQFYADGQDTPLMPSRNQFEWLSQSLKKLHPKFCDFKQIRASKITHWIKLHGLRKAQHLAGHKNIYTTEKYLAGEVESLLNDMENFHPLQ